MIGDAETEATKHLLRRLVNKLAQVIALSEPEPDDDPRRADGRTVCGRCKAEYWRHAIDPRAPWLNLLCNGERVKL